MPHHKHLHYVDGRYCCTDQPTSPHEACTHLRDAIEPQFDNFDDRFTDNHRRYAEAHWNQYCDDILEQPNE